MTSPPTRRSPGAISPDSSKIIDTTTLIDTDRTTRLRLAGGEHQASRLSWMMANQTLVMQLAQAVETVRLAAVATGASPSLERAVTNLEVVAGRVEAVLLGVEEVAS